MKNIKNRKVQTVVLGIVGLVLMILFSACSSVPGLGGAGSSYRVTGQVQSVSAVNHSVTVSVNGQSITINGLNSQELTALQAQVGKTYTIVATQNSDGSYTISTGSTPVNVSNTPGVSTGIETETPDNGQTPAASVQGTIEFIGKVQNVSGSAVTVSMPDGSTLTLNTVNGQTDLSDFNGALPGSGQLIKVEINANTDGSFTATKLSATDSGDVQDQFTVAYQGMTSSAVGSDNMIHFVVGAKSYNFAIGSGADLGDFNNSAQSITSNQAVKVDVLFQGATGTVQKVSNASN